MRLLGECFFLRSSEVFVSETEKNVYFTDQLLIMMLKVCVVVISIFIEQKQKTCFVHWHTTVPDQRKTVQYIYVDISVLEYIFFIFSNVPAAEGKSCKLMKPFLTAIRLRVDRVIHRISGVWGFARLTMEEHTRGFQQKFG